MKVTIKYRGGPRSMGVEVREMRVLPTLIGCVDEAHAKGMHGCYRKMRQDATETEATYEWNEMPLRIKAEANANTLEDSVAKRVLR